MYNLDNSWLVINKIVRDYTLYESIKKKSFKTKSFNEI